MGTDITDWKQLIPYGVALLLGGLIGLERELHRKPAGLRTNILICLSATLFTTLALSLKEGSSDNNSTARLLQGVITGVGFIGAGAVIQGSRSIHGITTAATIWLVSGIGIACGFQLYRTAVGVTVIALIVLWGLVPLGRRIRSREEISRVKFPSE
ncbi:MAG TPA: MgtC/SapB family protein [Anaerohalosphaeraceae bacterium]|jgi:putative Mg2+ transporter-C (MgtC) family protein|nr:MgtC/SapB family protein [Anaerohalosphaeraceae bacterium]HQG05084.1 MgtC/SapB family protein [Anaerohalosphaeraceae bacterium]HQI06257.1 MgtC/SapB family protein [Anaerohalosphaeraceae bacterium]HQJ67123.1 MgtC/SapB family protein [Anaerohalosphaeraceae bacterium]